MLFIMIHKPKNCNLENIESLVSSHPETRDFPSLSDGGGSGWG